MTVETIVLEEIFWKNSDISIEKTRNLFKKFIFESFSKLE